MKLLIGDLPNYVPIYVDKKLLDIHRGNCYIYIEVSNLIVGSCLNRDIQDGKARDVIYDQ